MARPRLSVDDPGTPLGWKTGFALRLAVIFRRFGPYHVARLEAAGRLGEVWGLEAGGTDRVYAWDNVPGSRHFQRATLFPTAAGKDRRQALQSAVARALDRIQPSAVAIPGWRDALALSALRWCVQSSTPAILMSDTTESDAPRRALVEWIKRRMVRLGAAGFVSGTRAADYLAKLGMEEMRIFKGYDVVDNGYFERECQPVREEVSRWRGDLRLPQKFFLVVSRFDPVKNLARLFEAYARYRADHVAPWDLVLCGDGKLAAELRSRANELHLDGLHWRGFVQYPDLPKYYALASALVLPSTKDTWGLVVNEAMACGLPVLVSKNAGCHPDLLDSGGNGYLLDPFDVDDVARKMGKLAHLSDEQRQAMGQRSRQIVADWGPERFAAGLWKAAQSAQGYPPRRVSPWDRALLGGLLRLQP